MKLRTLASAAALVSCVVFAGCYHPDDNGNGDDNGGGTAPTQTTVGDLAVGQIKTQTCDQAAPAAINSLTIIDSDAAVDVAMLTPGCNGS